MKQKVLLITSLISLVLFFLILLASYNNLEGIDFFVNSNVIHIQNNNLTSIFSFISYLFEPLNMILISFLISLILLVAKQREQALFFALTMTVGGIFIYILKGLVMKTRPLNGIIIETGYSFPSGHSLISILFFGLIILYFSNKKSSNLVTPTCILAIALVSFDRLYLNVHWLSDVLGGLFLGGFLLFLSLYLFNIYKTKSNPLNHKYTKNLHHH